MAFSADERRPLLQDKFKSSPGSVNQESPGVSEHYGPSAGPGWSPVIRIDDYLIICGIQVNLTIVCAVLAVASVVAMVAQTVALPVYAAAMVTAKSDPYCILLVTSCWLALIFTLICVVYKFGINRSLPLLPETKLWIIITAGVLNALNGLLVVYASDPSRTPAYLQAILVTLMIPYTVGFRYIILRKGVSLRRLLCTGAVLVGLFITMEPQIWGLDDNSSGGGEGPEQSMANRILWPMCFALGFVPAAILNVIQEREMKDKEGHSLNFLMWINIFQFLALVAAFWSDFIPGFGMADSAADFWDRLVTGLHCHFSTSCGVLGPSWLFITTFTISGITGLLLVKYADGAIYLVIVNALVTPLGALFWSLFEAQPRFRWKPSFTQTTAFTIAGLSIMMPAVALYNYFSQKEGAWRNPGSGQSEQTQIEQTQVEQS